MQLQILAFLSPNSQSDAPNPILGEQCLWKKEGFWAQNRVLPNNNHNRKSTHKKNPIGERRIESESIEKDGKLTYNILESHENQKVSDDIKELIN